jgi:single-stranded-DNA-specific exonuclease
MIKEKSRWLVEQPDELQEKCAKELASALSLSPLTARLLVRRGITDPESAADYLYGGPERLYDPFLLKGMSGAVQRIQAAIERGERIRIYGDYDADGVSSTCFMIFLFRSLGCLFDYYIPHRTLEGYGLNLQAIDLAADAGVKLIVTVDTGISAVEQIRYAAERGIDVVVTDHHEPPDVLPDAYAIVNPKQPGCDYPFKGLAGAGVAFKLGQALLGRPPLEWAEFAALGTIADLMPLTDENRIIVKCGLEQLRRTANPGFRALAEVSGIDLKTVNASTVAFGMAPRVNAAGRLDHANKAVQLLITENPDEAGSCADTLDALNRERQRIVDDIVGEADTMWNAKCAEAAGNGKPEPSVIVLAKEGWNAGVVGIVASKMIERYYRPTLILGIDAESGVSKGSARSIDGFDLHAALTDCAALLDHYGGHQAAAGMSLQRGRLDDLEAALCKLADEQLAEEDLIRKTKIDMTFSIADADLAAIEQISLLEPFGAGNPQPRLLLRNVDMQERKAMGKEGKHLRLGVTENGRMLEAVGFGFGGLTTRIADGAAIDLVGELSVNEWNGTRRPQLMIRDLRIPHVQLFDRRGVKEPLLLVRQLVSEKGAYPVSTVVLGYDSPSLAETAAASAADFAAGRKPEIYVSFEQWPDEGIHCTDLILVDAPPSEERLTAILKSIPALEAVHAIYGGSGRTGAFPEREHFGAVFQMLRRLAPHELEYETLPQRLAQSGWPVHVIDMMLDVFTELAFITVPDGRAVLVPSPAKRDLTESARYRRAAAEAESSKLWQAPSKQLADWIRSQLSEPHYPIGGNKI